MLIQNYLGGGRLLVFYNLIFRVASKYNFSMSIHNIFCSFQNVVLRFGSTSRWLCTVQDRKGEYIHYVCLHVCVHIILLNFTREFHKCAVKLSLPMNSRVLFLKGVMTLPSFLRISGLLLLSATFCFNRDRTFRFGSEAVGKRHLISRNRVIHHMLQLLSQFTHSEAAPNSDQPTFLWSNQCKHGIVVNDALPSITIDIHTNFHQ